MVLQHSWSSLSEYYTKYSTITTIIIIIIIHSIKLSNQISQKNLYYFQILPYKRFNKIKINVRLCGHNIKKSQNSEVRIWRAKYEIHSMRTGIDADVKNISWRPWERATELRGKIIASKTQNWWIWYSMQVKKNTQKDEDDGDILLTFILKW